MMVAINNLKKTTFVTRADTEVTFFVELDVRTVWCLLVICFLICGILSGKKYDNVSERNEIAFSRVA